MFNNDELLVSEEDGEDSVKYINNSPFSVMGGIKLEDGNQITFILGRGDWVLLPKNSLVVGATFGQWGKSTK